MPKKKIKVSHKMRRLVERAIKLHVDKATTSFYASTTTTREEADAARDDLARRARIAKESLLEEIGKAEGFLEAHRELRKGSLR